MSQCEGVNIYASGDYLLDERQGYLCSTIERLRTHMVTLKQKLEEEKRLLSELKAETQHLTRPQTANNLPAEINHYSCCQGRRSISQISLSSSHNTVYTGDAAKPSKPIEEPKQKVEGTELVHRLREIDNLCKEEMARMNSVVEQMEPLKQIASDWMLESKLNQMSGPICKDIQPAQPYPAGPGIEPANYIHPAYNGELIVVPPNRTHPPIPAIVLESRCDVQPDPIQTSIVKSSRMNVELESTKEPQLKLDCAMDPKFENDATNNKRSIFAKGKKENQRKDSSSEVSLSSLEALKNKNITLMDATDDCAKGKEHSKSTITSKSAISLESIQLAFANHHKMQRKAIKDETNALSVRHETKLREGKGKISLDRNKAEDEETKKDKLLAYLHPSAKKIVKNWVMVGNEEKSQRAGKSKTERSKRCTLNLARNNDAELSLCEDDVINKFLYDEEGYVYTPLFVSETEDSSDTSSLNLD